MGISAWHRSYGFSVLHAWGVVPGTYRPLQRKKFDAFSACDGSRNGHLPGSWSGHWNLLQNPDDGHLDHGSCHDGFAFLPMLAMFNDPIRRIAGFSYTQQMSLWLTGLGGMGKYDPHLEILLVDLAAAGALFAAGYKRSGLS